MPVIWSAPRTWSVGELVTAALLNQHLRDNLEYLKTPPTALYVVNQSSDYTTTSTSFVNVDNTNLALTINTSGGDVLIGFFGYISNGGGTIYLDVELDGVRIAGDDGLLRGAAAATQHYAFVLLKSGVSVGTHTFKLQWKVNSGTATLFAGAGTAANDVHPQFWVREVS
jgi:hypothetical protein